MTYSDDLKSRIVLLTHDGYSKNEIAKLLYISERLVKNVRNTYNKYHHINNPFKEALGRRRIFDNNDLK
ncbi:1238_t:CDS:1, partial [Racocetra persica]